jgi:phosphoribosylamine--glycine ligase
MNILLVGGGGREHALAWKLAQSPSCARLYAAPGNPGIAQHAELVAVDPADHAAVAAFCSDKRIGLVVIGPEAPLVDGLADSLRASGVAVFGPSRAAARLEGSKAFTKELCARAGIPTAAFVRCGSLASAREALSGFELPVVIKADGLAAGKGVVVAGSREEADAALAEMFSGRFGEAGREIVLEEFLEGEEASFFAITDGATIVPFGSAQDHKRVGDGDTGPNTGGMGAYSPARVLTPLLEGEAIERIVAPTVRAMREAGTPYSGVLYAGLMLTRSGVKLIEYNCRFGDPECQVLMLRLESDLAELLLACAENRLATAPMPSFSPEVALSVVMAAAGYPGTPKQGGPIRGIGGRVLAVTARGPTVREARAAAYVAVNRIDFPDGFCRKDIGWRELAREQARQEAREA